MPRSDRKRVAAIAADTAEHIDSVTDQFSAELSKIVDRARARTIAVIERSLDARSGRLTVTSANVRTLQELPKLFRNEMRAAGYDKLVDGFARSTNGVLPYFQEVLNAVTETWAEPPAPIEWTATDLKLFSQIQVGYKTSLKDLVGRIASQASERAMFSVGGMSVEDLAAMLSERYGKTLAQARTIAATALPTFYRTIAARGYELVEEGMPRGRKLRFTYEGPRDRLNREFCANLMAKQAAGRSYTHAQIDRMNNQQLPDVFTTCGGYNCRHQWVMLATGPLY